MRCPRVQLAKYELGPALQAEDQHNQLRIAFPAGQVVNLGLA